MSKYRWYINPELAGERGINPELKSETSSPGTLETLFKANENGRKKNLIVETVPWASAKSVATRR